MTPDISRQVFLRGGLGAVAGLLLGSCGETDSPEPQALADAPDWGALGESIQGQVTLPSSADYAGAKSLFNSRFDNSTPAAVVTVQSTGDVQQAVAFAAQTASKLPRVAADIPISVPRRQMASWSSTCVSCGRSTYDDKSGLVTIPAAADLDSVQTILAAQGQLIPRQLSDGRDRRFDPGWRAWF